MKIITIQVNDDGISTELEGFDNMIEAVGTLHCSAY